jgi:NAD-dependent DNA ligase
MAEKLSAAGFNQLGTLQAATVEDLEAIEGLGKTTAESLLAWAGEQESFGAMDMGHAGGDGEDSGTMDDTDFMAALSRAFHDLDGPEDATADDDKPAGESDEDSANA